MTATRAFVFPARIARRMPDPNFKNAHGMERHLFVVPVKDLPRELPDDPNARRARTKKRVYQRVADSLLNRGSEPGTFHLKNKGITILASSVVSMSDDRYSVRIAPGQGIVDGGHTYSLIMEHMARPGLPDNQYVNVEVRVGVPDLWIPDIAQGLNTSVQVQDMSLDNLKDLFEWLKDVLRRESYYGKIAWSENDDGDYDARDIISLLMAFNVVLFPNRDPEHPVAAYEKKAAALRSFEENIDTYKRMRRIVKDILHLYDFIGREAPELWNAITDGKAGRLSWVEYRGNRPHEFVFSGESGDKRLYDGALYPILAAYRWYVEVDKKSGLMRWRNGFDEVLRAFRERDARDLLTATRDMSEQLGRNPNAIGKSRPHWATLHTIVIKNDLMERAA